MQTESKSKIADAIIELHAAVGDLRDYREFPFALESVVKRLFHIDWLCMGTFCRSSESYNIVTNPALPFNWDEKYIEIYDIDTIRKETLKQPIGGTYLYQHNPELSDEKEVYLLETVKRHTDTSHFLTIHTAKTPGYNCAIGMYRADAKKPFTEDDKAILDYLSSVLVSFTNTMTLYADFELKRVTLEKLQNAQNVLTLALDDQLRPINIPPETKSFFKKYGLPENSRGIPEILDSWVREAIAPQGRLASGKGPWAGGLRLPMMELGLKAYAIVTELNQVVLLILLFPHHRIDDFSVLRKEGFTRKEVETISYLPMGYSNKQIAMAMNIQEITVKKHFKNSAKKLGAYGKVDTLYRAIRKKDALQALQIP